MPASFKRIVAQVLSMSTSAGNLLVELEFSKPTFWGKGKVTTGIFTARGSVARALPHWIYVGGTFDFQVNDEMTEIIGISEIRR